MRVPPRLAVSAVAFVLAACSSTVPPLTAPAAPVTTAEPGATDDGSQNVVPTGPVTSPPGSSPSPDVPPAQLLPWRGLYQTPDMLLHAADPSEDDTRIVRLETMRECGHAIDVLASGEWRMTSRAVFPAAWSFAVLFAFGFTAAAVLERGGDTLLVKAKGHGITADDPAEIPGADLDLPVDLAAGCSLSITPVPQVPVQATGVLGGTTSGRRYGLRCIDVAGVAAVKVAYETEAGWAFVDLEFPFTEGTHEASQVQVLAGTVDRSLWQLAADAAAEGVEGIEDPRLIEFEAQAPGSVSVTSTDPLAGTIDLPSLVGEDGERLSLSAGFDCAETEVYPPLDEDPEGPAESIAPQPTPAGAGIATITIASGTHAGSHEVASPNVSCSYNLFGDDSWNAGYFNEDEPRPGELQTLNVTLPEGGGRTSVLMTFGDDFDDDWFNASDATGEVIDAGDVVEFGVGGRSSGIDFEVDIVCYDIARF